MNTIASTRSGWSAPSSRHRSAPRDSDTSTARSVPVASITASASAANSSAVYASGSRGRSERPFPRPSNVTTRNGARGTGSAPSSCASGRSTRSAAAGPSARPRRSAPRRPSHRRLDVAFRVRVPRRRLLGRGWAQRLSSRFLLSTHSIRSADTLECLVMRRLLLADSRPRSPSRPPRNAFATQRRRAHAPGSARSRSSLCRPLRYGAREQLAASRRSRPRQRAASSSSSRAAAQSSQRMRT